MKTVIFTLILFVSTSCLAQNWAENNAVWHYNQTDMGPPFNDVFIKFSTIGDTVILGESTKIIVEERITLNDTIANEIFMKSDSNRVYLYDSPSNLFKLLYDFNATTGDTIEVLNRWWYLDSTTTIVVDSVSIININGTILGVQYVHQLDLPSVEGNMGGIILENIGWTGFMFPMDGLADPPYGGELRCFQNDLIGLYKPTAFDDCDYIETGIEPINNTNNFSIYPNPTKDVITIQINETTFTKSRFKLIDVIGKEVVNKKITSNTTSIDVSQYTKGVYFYQILHQKELISGNLIIQ